MSMRLELWDIDASRTAIGSALSTGINRLRELKSKSKILILMTDGQNNAGKVNPLTAAGATKRGRQEFILSALACAAWPPCRWSTGPGK